MTSLLGGGGGGWTGAGMGAGAWTGIGAGTGAGRGGGGGREKGRGRAKDLSADKSGAERLLVTERLEGAGYDTFEGVGPVAGNLIDRSGVTPDGRGAGRTDIDIVLNGKRGRKGENTAGWGTGWGKGERLE